MKMKSNERQTGVVVRATRWVRIILSITMAMVFLWVAFDVMLADNKPDANIFSLKIRQPGIALAAGEPSQMRQVAQDLAIVKTHTGNFQIGTQGTYFIIVTNVGTGQVNGAVTVSDALPTGLNPVQASGTGWTGCGISGQTVACSHENLSGLTPGNSLGTVSIIVNVTQAAAPSVTNTATLDK